MNTSSEPTYLYITLLLSLSQYCIHYKTLRTINYLISIISIPIFILNATDLRTKDENPILKHLGPIIQGAVWTTIGLVVGASWIYCLCCRKKARMTMEERDQEQKQKWEQNNGHHRF